MDGYEVIRRIRLFSEVPIVVLTVRDEEQDIARGLELGADDYVTKPFNHLELLSRLNAVLRRVRHSPAAEEASLELGQLRVDPNSRQVWVNGDLVSLTPVEFSLLYHLGRNAGTIQRHEALLKKVWGDEANLAGDRHLLNVHINKLRAKLGDDAKNPQLIMTERGIGYRLLKTATPV
jgi:DNA-binding response OmpR family regulator